MIRCELCNLEIADLRFAYRRVAGWEDPGRGAHGNSGSSLVLRERLDRFAHDTCIQKRKAGFLVGQEQLV